MALSGTFGIDLALDKATPEERRQLADGVKLYKNGIRDLVMYGELYRLVSPYETPLAAMSYVSKDKKRGVVYLYQTADGNVPVVKMDGLASDARYALTEVNLPSGTASRFADAVFTGRELMENGIANPLTTQFDSAVLRLEKID